MTKNNTPLFAEERKQEILRELEEKTKIFVVDLCKRFLVSSATIRNDLKELEQDGKLKRTHGGAILTLKTTFEPNSLQKGGKRIEQKTRIAERAADFVQDGDTILVDSGTTTEKLAFFLANKKQLVVVVNDIQIARYLEDHSNAEVVLIGGTMKKGFHCSTGPIAVNTIRSMNVDKAFLATNAFSIEKALTTPDMNQAELKKAMISVATKVFVLCDSSKFGKVSFSQFAKISQIHTLITDNDISSNMIISIKEANNNLEIITV